MEVSNSTGKEQERTDFLLTATCGDSKSVKRGGGCTISTTLMSSGDSSSASASLSTGFSYHESSYVKSDKEDESPSPPLSPLQTPLPLSEPLPHPSISFCSLIEQQAKKVAKELSSRQGKLDLNIDSLSIGKKRETLIAQNPQLYQTPEQLGSYQLRNTVAYFEQRPQVFAALHAAFIEDVNEKVVLSTHGLGGIGKSQMALYYLHQMQQQQKYTFYAWFNASSQEQLRFEYEQLALRAGLLNDEVTTEKAVSEVKRWLATGQDQTTLVK